MQPKFYTKDNLSWQDIEKESYKSKFIKVILYSLVLIGGLGSLIALFAIGISPYLIK